MLCAVLNSQNVAAQPDALQVDSQQRAQALYALGKRLFFDPRLSANGQLHCGSCHQPEQHFTDGLALSLNIHGQPLRRNTPTLFAVNNRPSLGWLDEGITQLSQQHALPMTRVDPVEMGAPQLTELNQDRELQKLATRAFGSTATAPTDLKPFLNLSRVTQALASFTRSLEFTSAFDRYLLHDESMALSPEAKRGLTLFTSPRLACASCHEGPDLGGGFRSNEFTIAAQFILRSTTEGRRKLRVPSLRAVAYTAPYMHDGRLNELDEVIEFYEKAESIEDLQPFTLSDAERNELRAFLEAL